MNCPHCNALVRSTQVYCGSCNHVISAPLRKEPTLPADHAENRPTLPEMATLPKNASSRSLPEQFLIQRAVLRRHPPPPRPFMAVPPPTSGKAIAALILGIVGLMGFDLILAPGIAAIILGHIARAEIRQRPGQLGGDGLALGGLICGYLGLFFSILFFLFLCIVVIFLLPMPGTRSR